MPQSAAVRDNEALGEMLTQQQKARLLPEEITADTTCGSDAPFGELRAFGNVRTCAAPSMTLLITVGGIAPKKGGAPILHSCGSQERALKERLAARREEQQTAEWKRPYAARSGIEGGHHSTASNR